MFKVFSGTPGTPLLNKFGVNAVLDIFETHFQKWRNRRFNQLQYTAEFVSKGLEDLFFVSIVFITAENTYCIQAIQQ